MIFEKLNDIWPSVAKNEPCSHFKALKPSSQGFADLIESENEFQFTQIR